MSSLFLFEKKTLVPNNFERLQKKAIIIENDVENLLLGRANGIGD